MHLEGAVRPNGAIFYFPEFSDLPPECSKKQTQEPLRRKVRRQSRMLQNSLNEARLINVETVRLSGKKYKRERQETLLCNVQQNNSLLLSYNLAQKGSPGPAAKQPKLLTI